MCKLTEKMIGRIQYDALAPGQFHHSLRDHHTHQRRRRRRRHHHYRRRRRRRHSELEGRDRNCAKYNILK